MGSEVKGVGRVFLVDVETKEIKMLRVPGVPTGGARRGHYDLLRAYKDTLIVKYSDLWTPPQVYAVRFKQIDAEGQTVGSLVGEANLEVNLLEKLDLLSGDDAFARIFDAKVKGYKRDMLKLDNGAEAMFVRAGDLDKGKKHPMLALLHGGPFGASPFDMFLAFRNFWLLEGYCLLIINYRGSIGYGEDFLNALLGNIGVADVDDCGQLTQLALERFSDEVDPKRVGVWGGSHGGFLTGHLIGHSEYKDLWSASALWNPVLDMTYMLSSTDIPDWIYACCKNQEIDFAQPSAEDRTLFFERSPISSVHRVKTPALLLIGDSD